MCKMMNLLMLSLGVIVNSVYAFNPVDVTDITFNIGGGSEKSFCFKFAGGDTLIINACVTKGNDISEISVIQWPTSIKFQATGIRKIENKKIFVPKTTVYTIKFKNTATFKSKTYQINIKRIPSNDELVFFNTTVEWDTLYDTTYVAEVQKILRGVDTIPEEIVNTQIKVGSQLSGDPFSYIQIDIPEGTDYLAYWIGVGQEANEGLQKMTKKLPEAAVSLGIVNPVVAFAIGLIPELFSSNRGQQVDYYFIADYQNLINFLSGQTFYMIKKGEEVITDYAKMDAPQQNRIYLGLYNSHGRLSDRLVTINVVAVRTEPQYEYHDIKRPVVKKRAVPILE